MTKSKRYPPPSGHMKDEPLIYVPEYPEEYEKLQKRHAALVEAMIEIRDLAKGELPPAYENWTPEMWEKERNHRVFVMATKALAAAQENTT